MKLVTEQGYKTSEVTRNLGIHVSLLRKWIQKISVREGKSDEIIPNIRAELKRLRKENERLRMEREILKRRQPSLPANQCKV